MYIIHWKSAVLNTEGQGAMHLTKRQAEDICKVLNTLGDGRTYWIEPAGEEEQLAAYVERWD